MKIPEPTDGGIAQRIDEHHEKKAQKLRPHLGASLLGHKCDRWLWLSFRWAVQPEFPGRILRLFRRGQNEETTVISDLRAIGIIVKYVGGKQTKVDLGCHVSGSMDGVIESGVPEAPKAKHVLEIKTHNLKSFNDLKKNGVKKSKPQHYIQMQVYMNGSKIKRALYVAVCKDNDEYHFERIKYNKDEAEKEIKRAQRIALLNRMPEPLSADPSWFECKFCDAYKFCHQAEPTKHVNCRTCAHSTAFGDSTFGCGKYGTIPNEFQEKGCECHVLHEDMVPWERKVSSICNEAIYLINGTEVRNGESDANVFGSSEILANSDGCTTKEVKEVRKFFEAKIVG